jgi:hypothetical protein
MFWWTRIRVRWACNTRSTSDSDKELPELDTFSLLLLPLVAALSISFSSDGGISVKIVGDLKRQDSAFSPMREGKKIELRS